MSVPLRAPEAGTPPGETTTLSLSYALQRDVIQGLKAMPKTLPAALFYDAEGARLFERICTLEEYYLTRTEMEILRGHRHEIAELSGPDAALIEYGSGAGEKVRLLLDALDRPAAYVPVDISEAQLMRVAADLAADYPAINVLPVCADYTRRFSVPPLPSAGRRIAFFPGSTIGNFHPPEAAAFLRRVRTTVGTEGRLILGVDRLKDSRTLNAAYNDASGITAAFNLNMLARLNQELGADFDLSRFRHRAWFNEAARRIEMHLECAESVVIRVAGESIAFERGETIWTESSYKYDRGELETLVSAAGFRVERLWTDVNQWFWIGLLVAKSR